MLSVLTTTHTHITKAKGQKETSGDYGYAHFLECVDGSVDVCISHNLLNNVH